MKAGAGKTFLTSLVIDKLTESATDDTVLYFYCRYNEEERRQALAILRSLVRQAFFALKLGSPAADAVEEMYAEQERKGFSHGGLGSKECLDLLATTILPSLGSNGRIFIVIDALDECEDSSRTELLRAFQHICSLVDIPVRIFVSSRDNDDIVLHLDNRPNVYINSEKNSSDVRAFVDEEVDKAINERRILRGKVDNSVRESIKSALVQGANGM
jgi:hypothetical protein